MCGIAGIVGPSADRALVERMADRLAHRGPDDRGSWSADGVALGHRRLAVLDLSAAGHQPMSLDEHVLVYNGELYDFRHWRRRLDGPFVSDTDTEVLLHLLRRDGASSLADVHGMFAFALWDAKDRRLLAARDRLGIKPLLYRPLPGGGLAFASELKALVDLDGPLDRPPVDPEAVRDYFTYKYVPTPRTIYRGIHKLPPGHLLHWQADHPHEIRIEPWWQAETSESITDPEEALEELDTLLETVVREHTVADVPVGVFLSGGLDSTTLVTHLDRPHTFTLGFDVRSHDEAAAARRIAEHVGAEHRGETASGVDLEAALDGMPSLYDEPFGDHGCWAMYLVARLARRHVTVALTGEGGDELFAGYPWYRKYSHQRATVLQRLLARLLPPLSPAARSAHRRSASGVERYSMFLGPFTPQQKRVLLSPRLLAATGEDYDDLWYSRRYWREELSPLKRLQWADLHTYLADDMLTKVDRATMAVSLEARPPLVDHRIVDFALRLHPSLLHDGERGKVLTRRHLRGRVPDEVLDRRKIGFSMPVRHWVRRRPELLQSALDRLAEAGIVRRRRPRSRLPTFTNEQCWCLLVLDRWLHSSTPGRGPQLGLPSASGPER